MPVLDIPLPSHEMLGRVMDDCVKTAEEEGMQISKMDEKDRTELIKSTMGLTVMEANVAYNKAIHAHEDLTTGQIPFILNEKKQIIKRTGILEYIEPGHQRVGGLGELTNWLSLRKGGFSREAEEYGLEYPRGLLLLGFPGCGKSLTAIHTAKTWNYPLLRFDIGRAFGSLVGESERNMRQALKVAEAISPCILWLDEIEKGLSGVESSGQTDGGTSARVLATFLTWMQEKSKPVFVLATCNNIDRMPPELTRKGRFDEIFFVDLPKHASRKDIFEIHVGDKPEESRGPMGGYDFDKLANASAGYTGAEIKQAVVEGMHVSFSEKRRLTEKDVLKALSDTYPMYESMRDEIENMRLRKGKMYKPAEKGDSEPLPKRKGDTIPLTRKEKRRNPFLD
jgi:SpoVK/Ycf46/Vps4 family AAA+-type ATPase